MSQLRCPACGDRGTVDARLECSSCGAALEYAEPRTLRVRPGSQECPECRRDSPYGQERCEHCGARLLERCPLCSGMHERGAATCRRQGEPIPPRRAPAVAAGLALFLVAGALMAALTMATATSGPGPVATPPPIVTISGAPRIDVVFVIDSTGSMADEIDVVKRQVRSMMAKIRSGDPEPQVRFGLVTYRDRGDAYVTRTEMLTPDLDRIQAAVDALEADGGGDLPESVNEALHVAVADLNWDEDQAVRKVMFLIGDAGPHMDYADDYDYRAEVRDARRKGIKTHVWGCSGIEDHGEGEFREVASLGNGDFEFLTYRQRVVRDDGREGYLLYHGGAVYEQVDEEADWKAGAGALVSASKARSVPAAEAAAPPAAVRYGGAGVENNLDRMLTEQVMSEARDMGVSY